MIIKSVHIIAFGGLRNRDIDLSRGVNVIEGQNESGKSSVAMFIKFIFYGLSGKKPSKNEFSERDRFINKDTMQAAGFIIAQSSEGSVFRIERSLIADDVSAPREKIRIINQGTGETVSGQEPGFYFFNIPEEIFVSTCFVAQASAVRPSSIAAKTSSDNTKAVGNLLTSADEDVDISAAIKRLDDTRRELLHRRGTGGELKDMKKRLEELKAERDSSAEKSEKAVALSTSLEEINNKISSLEKAKEHYSAVFSALEKINLKKKIEASDQAKERIDKLSSALKAIDNSPLGNGFEESILESEKAVENYDSLCAEYEEKVLNSDEDLSQKHDIPDYDETVNKIYDLESSCRRKDRWFYGLLVAFFLSVAATAGLWFFNTSAEKVVLIISVVVLALCILTFVLKILSSKKLSMLYDEWEIGDDDEVETAVHRKIEELEISNHESDVISQLSEKMSTGKLLFDAAESKIHDLAKAAKVPESDDIYVTIDALKNVNKEIQEQRVNIVSKIDNLSGRLELLTEQIGDTDRNNARIEAEEVLKTDIGKKAESMEQEAIKKLAKERDFTDGALSSAVKRRHFLEDSLNELGVLGRSPDELQTLINSLEGRIEELSLRYDACELARESLEKAGESVRAGILPRISEKASAIISAATGKYEKMTVDDSLSCGVASSSETVTSEHLSHGTEDLTYIALRLAVADEVLKTEKSPIIFDESFAHIDSSRIRNILRMLSMNSSDNQYIIFTCRAEEKDHADSLGLNTIQMTNDLSH